MNQMMKCGCVAMAETSQFRGVKYDPPIPACVTHDCIEPAKAPDLTERTALCAYRSCGENLERKRDTHYGKLGEDGRSYAPSSLDLPFFVYKPTKEYDEYFCGCMGWD